MPGPYNFNPYTGQPLQRPRTWMDGYAQPSQQPIPGQQVQGTQPTRQISQPGVIVRPVASYEEAKAVPTDFSGNIIIMPDWAHGYIYVKALGDDGNPIFRSYRYEPEHHAPALQQTPTVEYAPLSEVERLRTELDALREELSETLGRKKEPTEKPAGRGAK